MKTLVSSLKLTLLLGVVLFVGYVLVLWGFAALFTSGHGAVEVVTLKGRVVGAAQVGQPFTQRGYFWGRPSAVGYDGGGSGGSNKGVSDPAYLQEVQLRIETFLAAHPYLDRKELPSELVTASGSGLDPHISPGAAEVQVRRIAQARGASVEQIQQLVQQHTVIPLIGPSYIHVLELNVALDQALHRSGQ